MSVLVARDSPWPRARRDTEPRTSPWREKRGGGGGAAPASGMAEVLAVCRLEERRGHFCTAVTRRRRALSSGVQIPPPPTARSVTLGKYSDLSQLSFLLFPIFFPGEVGW